MRSSGPITGATRRRRPLAYAVLPNWVPNDISLEHLWSAQDWWAHGDFQKGPNDSPFPHFSHYDTLLPGGISGRIGTWSIVDGDGFDSLLFGIPATNVNLQTLADQFNAHYGTDYRLSKLNGDGLDNPTDLPVLSNLTPDKTPLLTASTFVVGTTSGEYKDFAVIEMDDAVIGKVCYKAGVKFGFVRNVSDPAQNAALPSEVQRNWGGAVYDVFGFYTSYNGALVTWAMIAALDS